MKESEFTGWMWAEACGLIEQAERLQRQFFRIGLPRERAPAWEPPVDIYESSGELTIYVALPGVRADNVRVLIEDDVLSIVGARLLPRQSETAIVHRLEIPHGRFERRLRLPTRKMKVTHSQLDNGCLTLVLRGV